MQPDGSPDEVVLPPEALVDSPPVEEPVPEPVVPQVLEDLPVPAGETPVEDNPGFAEDQTIEDSWPADKLELPAGAIQPDVDSQSNPDLARKGADA